MIDEASGQSSREASGQSSRERAVTQLKKRRDFRTHLVVYLLFNGFLTVIWALTDLHGFFWPIFLIAGWGIGLVMNAWDVYWRHEITEGDIQHEIERERQHSR